MYVTNESLDSIPILVKPRLHGMLTHLNINKKKKKPMDIRLKQNSHN